MLEFIEEGARLSVGATCTHSMWMIYSMPTTIYNSFLILCEYYNRETTNGNEYKKKEFVDLAMNSNILLLQALMVTPTYLYIDATYTYTYA